MKDTALQLTIRGLDAATKAALVAKAKQQGVSLNRLALNSLCQSASLNTVNDKMEAMLEFLAKDPISKEAITALNEAVAWGDKADKEKQEKDARDAGF